MMLMNMEACILACGGGIDKLMTVMGVALVDGLSDAGSTPARSTYFFLL